MYYMASFDYIINSGPPSFSCSFCRFSRNEKGLVL